MHHRHIHRINHAAKEILLFFVLIVSIVAVNSQAGDLDDIAQHIADNYDFLTASQCSVDFCDATQSCFDVCQNSAVTFQEDCQQCMEGIEICHRACQYYIDNRQQLEGTAAPVQDDDDLDNDDADDTSEVRESQPGDSTGSNVPPPPAASACGNGILESGEQCDDGNDNDVDGCSNDCRVPSSGCLSHSECDDGIFCNGPEFCFNGVCRNEQLTSLDDGVACTRDTCDEENDIIIHEPVDSLCDDQLYCTGVEQCDVLQGCLVGTPISCPADHVCIETSQSCELAVAGTDLPTDTTGVGTDPNTDDGTSDNDDEISDDDEDEREQLDDFNEEQRKRELQRIFEQQQTQETDDSDAAGSQQSIPLLDIGVEKDDRITHHVPTKEQVREIRQQLKDNRIEEIAEEEKQRLRETFFELQQRRQGLEDEQSPQEEAVISEELVEIAIEEEVYEEITDILDGSITAGEPIVQPIELLPVTNETEPAAVIDVKPNRQQVASSLRDINRKILKKQKVSQVLFNLQDDQVDAAVVADEIESASDSLAEELEVIERELAETTLRVEETLESMVIEKDLVVIQTDETVDSEAVSVVRLNIAPKERMFNVTIYEEIPKSIAADASELVFYNENVEIIEADPLVAFQFAVLDQDTQVSYGVNKNLAPEDVAATETVPIAEQIGDEDEFSLLKLALPVAITFLIIVSTILFKAKETRAKQVEEAARRQLEEIKRRGGL